MAEGTEKASARGEARRSGSDLDDIASELRVADFVAVRNESLAAIRNQSGFLRYGLPITATIASLGFGLEGEPLGRLAIVGFFAPLPSFCFGLYWLDEYHRMIRAGDFLARIADIMDGSRIHWTSFITWKRGAEDGGAVSRLRYCITVASFFLPCVFAALACLTVLYDASVKAEAIALACWNGFSAIIGLFVAWRTRSGNRANLQDNNEFSCGMA